jgi:hypothetical protein
MKRSTDPGVPTAERYRAFAEVEARGMSDCYEHWALGVAGDDRTLHLIDRLPASKRQPNLVFSAARFVGAPVTGYRRFAEWLADHWAEVESVCLTHATQTNEPGRCAALLPSLAAIPGPLALIEVGASAGLCLYPDRYSYRYHLPDGVRTLHPASGPSAVVLDCEATGPVLIPEALPEVAWRAGIDLNPLDVASADDVAWLDALIWPEHEDRRARLHAAVELVRAEAAGGAQAELVRGDLVSTIESVVESAVERAPSGASVVVFHTAVLAYLDAENRQRFAEIMERLPVTWLANEGRGVVPGVLMRLDETRLGEDSEYSGVSSDFVLARNGAPLAFAQPHGRAIHWLQ